MPKVEVPNLNAFFVSIFCLYIESYCQPRMRKQIYIKQYYTREQTEWDYFESHLKWDESSKMEYWHSCKRFRLVPPLRLAFSFSISKVARSQFHALLVFIWIEPFLQTSSVTRTTVNFQEFSKGIPKALIKSLFRKWIKNRVIPSANIGILTFRFYFFSKSDSSATVKTF